MKKKIIAVLLITILSSTPVLQSVYAAENNTIEVQSLDSFNFTSKDPENENIGYIESEGYKGEVNIETGDITHTLYNEDESVKETYTTNYYENLKNLGAETPGISTRSIIVQQSAGKLYYSVNRTTRDYITIKNTKGTPKSYSKAQNTYYSGNTKLFMEKVDDAKIPYGNMVTTLVTAGLVISLVAYLGITTSIVTTTMMKTALTSIGAAGIAGIYVYMTEKYNTYRRAGLSADHYYNSI